jgi:hypothetical protein
MIGTPLAPALTAPASFVALDDVDPTILQDIRLPGHAARSPLRCGG